MKRRNFIQSLIVVFFAPWLIERFAVKQQSGRFIRTVRGQTTKWSFYKNGTLISEFTLPNDGGVVVAVPRKLHSDQLHEQTLQMV